jgi:hypothetical protein
MHSSHRREIYYFARPKNFGRYQAMFLWSCIFYLITADRFFLFITTIPTVFALVTDTKIQFKSRIDHSSSSSLLSSFNRRQSNGNTDATAGGASSSSSSSSSSSFTADWSMTLESNEEDDHRKPPPPQQQQHNHHPRRRRGHGRNQNSLETQEQQQKAHLQWMVRTTGQILGQDAPPSGEMSPHLLASMYPLMQAWVQRARSVPTSKAPHVVERLLQRMLQERNAVNEARDRQLQQPSMESSSGSVTRSNSSCDTSDQQNDGPPRHMEVSMGMYNAVLEAWSNCKEEGSAERAEEILLQMEQVHHLQPTVNSYNAVIKAYVKNGHRNIAAKKAQELIEKMEATNHPNDILPNLRSYNLLLYSLANAPDGVMDHIAERAQAVLERMIQRCQYQDPTNATTTNSSVTPNINSFNQVMKCWARGESLNFEENMMKVYQLLLDWRPNPIEPDKDTFNTLMGGWLKSKDPTALFRIQEIFNEMKESFAGGNLAARPDRVSINTLQVALNRQQQQQQQQQRRNTIDAPERLLLTIEKEFDIPPNYRSQNILMDSIVKSGVADAPEQVLAILNRMENEFKNGNQSMKPDHCSYCAVMLAYIHQGRENTIEIAENMLSRAWDMYRQYGGNIPNVKIYNSVINALASLEGSKSLSRVKDILSEMENGEQDGIPRPGK